MASTAIVKSKYNGVHLAVISRKHDELRRILLTFPKLVESDETLTESVAEVEMKNIKAIEETLDVKGFGGETALHLAVRLNDKESASVLAEAGASLRIRNDDGKTPLDEAYCRKNFDISKVLLIQRRRFDSLHWKVNLKKRLNALISLPDFYTKVSVKNSLGIGISSQFTLKVWKRESYVRAEFCDGMTTFTHWIQPDGSMQSMRSDDVERKVNDTCQIYKTPFKESELETFCSNPFVGYSQWNSSNAPSLTPVRDWFGREKTEMIGTWNCGLYRFDHVLHRKKIFASKRTRNFHVRSDEVVEDESSLDHNSLVIPQPITVKSSVTTFCPLVWLATDIFPFTNEDLQVIVNLMTFDSDELNEVVKKIPQGKFPVKISVRGKLVVKFKDFVHFSTPEHRPNSSPFALPQN